MTTTTTAPSTTTCPAWCRGHDPAEELSGFAATHFSELAALDGTGVAAWLILGGGDGASTTLAVDGRLPDPMTLEQARNLAGILGQLVEVAS
jgi:hypothetical protein